MTRMGADKTISKNIRAIRVIRGLLHLVKSLSLHQFPPFAIFSPHEAVEFREIGNLDLLGVPLDMLAHSRTLGQTAQQHDFGERSAVIEIRTWRSTALFAGTQEVGVMRQPLFHPRQ